MSYETEEQQVERLKEWWSENGTPLVVGAVLGLAGFGGWKYWNEKQEVYQTQASDLYVQVADILKTEKKEGLVESAEAVKTQYPDSTYAILAAFHLAKAAVDAGDLDEAAAELAWVVETKSENELVQVAKIRLARVLMQQDKAAEALPLVEVVDKSGYYSLASLVKGDVLVALDRKTEALDAYKIASADMEVVARHPTLQLKIDALSEPEVAPLAPETIEATGSADTTSQGAEAAPATPAETEATPESEMTGTTEADEKSKTPEEDK